MIEDHSEQAIVNSSWGLSSPPGHYFLIFLAWFEFLMICSLALLTYVYATSARLKRRQALWLIIATFIPLSIGTVTDGVMPVLGKDVLPVGIPLTTVTALIIAYAISRYDLFEVNTRNIMASLGEGVLSIDTKGRIMFINEIAEKLLGYKRKEIVGEKVLDIVSLIDEKGRNIPPQKRPTYMAIHKGMTRTYRNFQLSTKRKRKFWVGFTVSPMRINGSIVGASLNFRDISAEKKAEKNRDEFISIASHELKTPVTVLKLSAQMLEKQMNSQDPNYSSTVSRINNQTDRLVNLIGDLLNVSRLQTGKFVYNNEKIRVQKLINYSLRQVRPSIEKRKIIKDVSTDAELEVDKEKISQVIGNLLVNADKYSPKDEEIKISAKQKKGSVQITVSDKGPGIPKNMRRKIFGEYYQANSAGAEAQGLGIGLYVSSQIVKDHGGKLWVEQNGKKGSRFIFSLPTAQMGSNSA
jgi:PAS domain S-box-containing protein